MLILIFVILLLVGTHFYVKSLELKPLRLKPLEPFKGNSTVCYFHCHTTGLDRSNDRMVQFCIVRYRFDRKSNVYVREELKSNLFSSVPIEKDAKKKNGLDQVSLVNAPVFSEVAGDIRKFVGKRTIIVFMASFHRAFLNAEFERIGYPKLRVTDLSDLIYKRHESSAAMRFDDLLESVSVPNRGITSAGRANNVADVVEKLGLYKNPKRKENAA